MSKRLGAGLVVLGLLVSCVENGNVPPVASEPSSGAIPGEPAVVERVVDGDTVIAVFRGRELRVRLIGIDAPESAIPDQPPECFGPQAAAFAVEELDRRTVNLEFDVERLDDFGRTLAYVWLPGPVLFNERLVRLGYARVTTFPPNVRHVDRLVTAQAAARQEERGMWSPDAC